MYEFNEVNVPIVLIFHLDRLLGCVDAHDMFTCYVRMDSLVVNMLT